MSLTIIVAIVIGASIIICHQLAKRRGRDPVLWGLMGAIFGPLAIPFIYFAKTEG